MSCVLKALKAIESHQAPRPAEPRVPNLAATASPVAPAVCVPPVVPAPAADSEPRAALVAEIPPAEAAPASPALCVLPTVPVVADSYSELARNLAAQLDEAYCSVLLFVSPDQQSHEDFSIVHAAQAIASRSAGDVLVVDGDLSGKRLSNSTGMLAPGMVEIMQGTAAWTDAIHSTANARLDFVPCGGGELHALSRAELNFSTLRPKYRAVLIGLAEGAQPETARLAAQCDATYLVVCRPRTRRQSAETVLANLREAGANVLGTLVVGE